MGTGPGERRDLVDLVVEQWGAERPHVDVSPMHVVGRISRAAALLDRRLAQRFADLDLLPGEFDVLATLLRSGAPHRLTVGQLTAQTMVTAGAVSHRLRGLEERGLVERTTEPTNRRVVNVQLTRAGADLVDHALAAHVEHEDALLAPLDPEQRDQLAALLRTLLLAHGDSLA